MDPSVDNLMMSGVELMLVGMGTVFVFLTLLVAATTLMSRIVLRIAPPAPVTTEELSEEELAVITAAVHAHRNRR